VPDNKMFGELQRVLHFRKKYANFTVFYNGYDERTEQIQTKVLDTRKTKA